MPDNPKLTFIIKDNKDNSQTIPMSTFVKVINGVNDVVSEVDRTLNDTNKRTAEWKIVGLKTGSPAEMTISPVSLPSARLPVEKLTQEIYQGLKSIQSRKKYKPNGFSENALISLRQLAHVIGNKFTLQIDDSKESIVINSETVAQIDSWRKGFHASIGTLEGKLQRVYAHDKLEFSIWERSGLKVDCQFTEDLFEDVTKALENKSRVCIRGKIKYRDDGNPVSVSNVTLIHEFKKDSDLPSVDDVIGVWSFPQSSDEYVKEMRNGRQRF